MDAITTLKYAGTVLALVLATRKVAPRIDGLWVIGLALVYGVLVGVAYSVVALPAWAVPIRDGLVIALAAISSTHLADRIGDRVGAPPQGQGRGDKAPAPADPLPAPPLPGDVS